MPETINLNTINRGPKGDNGTTVLSSYNSLTGIGTDNNLNEKTLFTYNLIPSLLGRNGDELELVMYYEYNNADTVNLNIKLGAEVVTFPVTGTDDFNALLILKISRISASSQLWLFKETINTPGTGKIDNTLLQIDSSTLDLTKDLSFIISAQNTALGANQLLLKKATLYKYSTV